ncbi:hypothetical protein CRM22_009298 [Opisthorchis felineus]|uniref:FAM86 N-terminal domain-containing protein n=1 Tax=Opisthorchis felineus TaxID=147828 RepID=A0A4S2LEG9_OPIFE|nr:hypothetical protein CRM22_009298 [Opisthorchis felineus]
MGEQRFSFISSSGDPLDVVICSSGSFGSDVQYGRYTWRCAEALSQYIVKNCEQVDGRRILELGAGTGLCGLVASLCGASWVTFSDRDHTLEGDLLRSAQSNGITQFDFSILDWEFPTRYWRPRPFDLILASDTLFDKRVYEPFLRTAALLLSSLTNAYLLLSIEPRRSFTDISILMKKYSLCSKLECGQTSCYEPTQIYRVEFQK